MIETAINSFKNRPAMSSFSLVNIACKHKLDAITLSGLGLSSFQCNQVFKVLNQVEKKEATLEQIQLLTPNELLICTEDSFSTAVSLWILFESLIVTHNPICTEDKNELIEATEKPVNSVDDLVEDLNLSVRTLNVLRKEKISTISTLSRYSRDELLDLPNLGVASVNEIEDLLVTRGFKRTLKSVLQLNSQIETDMPLTELNLSVRTFNGLMRNQITRLSDLMKLSFEDVKDIRQLGEKSISEVMDLQNKYRSFFNDLAVGDVDSEARDEVNFDWARTNLVHEIAQMQKDYGELLETSVHQISLEYFDYVSGFLISREMPDRNISIKGIFSIISKTLLESHDKIVILSLVNLVSVMRTDMASCLSLRLEFDISAEERQAFSQYEQKYANDVIDLVEFDSSTLSLLGFDVKETKGFLGKQSFFELLELLQTQFVTYEKSWEIVKGIKNFFKTWGTFPNIAGLVIATALSEEFKKEELRELFRRYFEIERPEYAERDSLIVMLRIEKKTLDQIGQAVGLTRERVRQIIRKISPTLEAAIEYLVLEKEGSFSPVSEEIFKNIFHEYGAVYLSELATLLELDVGKVLSRTPRKFHKYIIDKSIPPVFVSQWSKEDVIAILRKAGTYYFPLKTSDYEYLLEIGEISGPSVPFIYNKYGTWTEMCITAGVEPAASMRGEYVVLWNEGELISFLQRYLLDEGTTGTASGYDEWREQQHDHVPSGVLIRNQFERWSDAKRIALEGFRISRGKAVRG